MNEVEFIKFLTLPFPKGKEAQVPPFAKKGGGDLLLGIGDDAAVISIPPSQQLVISCDNAIEGVHFPPHSELDKVGYRACVAALSDLAAMAAQPRWAMLSVTMPQYSEDSFYHKLAEGILSALYTYGVILIGGNTTRGPLNLGVTVMGLAAKGQYVTRQAAKAGDGIYVTGTLGDAALGLKSIQGHFQSAYRDFLEDRFWRPTARFEMVSFLQKVQASSCIDISDGLKGDLEHILKASGVGAIIESALLPLSTALQQLPSQEEAWRLALTGGEDYELCFTAPKALVAAQKSSFPIPVTYVGEVTRSLDYKILGFVSDTLLSYRHF
jgi:thiamine-monophosphate kinase